MVATKTTKEIIELHNKYWRSENYNIGDDLWVSLDELKKELDNLISAYEFHLCDRTEKCVCCNCVNALLKLKKRFFAAEKKEKVKR